MANSLDQVGVLAQTTSDTAEVLSVIAGYDPKDATSVNRPIPDCVSVQTRGVRGLRIGVPQEFFATGLEDGVRQEVQATIDRLRDAGAEIVPVSLPLSRYAVSIYYVVMSAEVSTNLSRYDGIRFGHSTQHAHSLKDIYAKSRGEGFGDEAKRRILLGTYVLSSAAYDAYYAKAQKVRTLLKQEFDEVFQSVDVIVGPTAPTVAFEFGSRKDPLSMYLGDLYTIPANLVGIPALSVPCGQSDGKPVGFQIMAPYWRDDLCFQVGSAVEALTELAAEAHA
jgi:aspartyl-tRNA(Asn)/glutamyl-tRNA(Gln) amidotransferase subunit A